MKRLALLSHLAAAALLLQAAPAQAQGVLTVAMTAGDLPVTGGNPDQASRDSASSPSTSTTP